MLAIRQLVMSQGSGVETMCQQFQHKASVVLEILAKHAEFFGASQTGKGLLSAIMVS